MFWTDVVRVNQDQNRDRTLVVIGCPGVGKATIIGNMIYKVWHYIVILIR